MSGSSLFFPTIILVAFSLYGVRNKINLFFIFTLHNLGQWAFNRVVFHGLKELNRHDSLSSYCLFVFVL